MLAKTLIGQGLQDYRHARGLTMNAMSLALGLTRQQLAEVEAGTIPATRDLERIITDAYPDFLTV